MSRKLLMGTLLLGTGIVAVVLGLGRHRVIYSYSVSTFFERPHWDERVRVKGVLAHGSLCRVADECGYHFRLSEPGSPRTLSVNYPKCTLPDTFREVPGMDVEGIVEGQQCQTCHDFEASQVMARGSGEYEMSSDGGSFAAVPYAREIPRCPDPPNM